MYQTKKIYYKAIFKQDDQTDKVEYKAEGVVSHDDKTRIHFVSQQQTIDIIYDDKQVVLKNNQSKLRFELNKKTWNHYQLPYGEVRLCTHLLMFEANEETLKMKYELSDFNGLISTVYIFIKMTPLTIEKDS